MERRAVSLRQVSVLSSYAFCPRLYTKFTPTVSQFAETTLWHTNPANMPALRHVQREVRQNAEDANAEVRGGQVSQTEVDDAAHLAVQQDDGDDQHVT